jgi:hypothetical protein
LAGWGCCLRYLSFVAALLLAYPATSAGAVTFSGDFSITAQDQDPGLVIQVNPVSGPLDFTLDQGESTSFALFDIWTNEGTVNGGEDTVGDPISVAFHFDEPLPPFGAPLDGTTDGVSLAWGIVQYGEVSWNNPLDLAYGPLGDGLLRVTLSNETFNPGFFGLGTNGATVNVTFELVAAASEDPIGPSAAAVAAVPVPPAIALFVTAVAGLGAGSFRMRRRGAAPGSA